jgi:hypothetical protein
MPFLSRYTFYTAEKVKGTVISRACLLVLASDWLGRWKAPVHMIHEPVTNVGVLFLQIPLPALLQMYSDFVVLHL